MDAFGKKMAHNFQQIFKEVHNPENIIITVHEEMDSMWNSLIRVFLVEFKGIYNRY